MERKRSRFILLVLLVAFVARIFRIGAQSLWVDELFTLTVSTPEPGFPIWEYLKYNIHGPLHSFVVYLFHFVDMSDAWLRLPSALAGVGAIYFFYRWVALWLGEREARIATVLLAIHPLHIFYSQELRNYSFLLFFAMLSNFYFHQLRESESKRNYSAYVLAIACTALCNLSSVFLFVIHSILFLAKKDVFLRRLGRWAIVCVAVLVLVSPWVYRVYRTLDVSRLVTPVKPGEIVRDRSFLPNARAGIEVVPYTVYAYSVGFSLGPSTRELHHYRGVASVIGDHAAPIAWVSILFGCVFVFGCVRVGRGRYPRYEVLLYCVIPILLVGLIVWQNAKVFNVRYTLLAFPPFLCVLAVALANFTPKVRAVLLGLLLATLVDSLTNYYFDGRYARDDIRGAAQAVKARSLAGECIIAPSVLEVFTHYYDGPAVAEEFYSGSGRPKAQVDSELEKLFANCDALWYVRAREWASDPDDYVLTRLSEHYPRSQESRFDGVTLLHFTR